MTQPFQLARARRNGSAHARLFGTGDLNPMPHACVIVAHPGDEIVGAGCLISKLVDVTVLHITDGAPPDDNDARKAGYDDSSAYTSARRHECLTALALAGVAEDRVIEFGLQVQSVSRHLADLTRRITTFLQQCGGDVVVTHPYEGGHPDHDATAFAVHTALQLMKRRGFRPPVLFELALHPGSDFTGKVPEFLPGPEGETTTLVLDERARKLKQRMFDCLKTERESLKISPIGPEKFRQPLSYDFRKPPKPGSLFYEKFEWAPRSTEWQSLARKALAELSPVSQSRDPSANAKSQA